MLAGQESAELFSALVAGIKDYAIFLLDPDGCVASWNLGAERIKGYQANEIIGRHFSCFYLPGEVAQGKPARELKDAAVYGRIEDEGWRLRKDGTRFRANVVITSLRDPSGRLRGFIKIARDVSDRTQMEEALRSLLERTIASEAKFRRLVESAPDGIVIVDRAGRIQLINHQTAELFGYREEELLQQPVEVLLPERFRAAHGTHRDAYAKTARVRPMGEGLDLWGRRKDGSEFPVEISLSPLTVGDDLQVMSVIRDITERRRREEQIQKLHASLQQRAADLEAANQELAAYSYSIAHNLRAPLRAIDGLSHLAIENAGNRLPAESRRQLDLVLVNIMQMGRLIDDLLEFFRLGRLELHKKQVAPADLVRQCLEELRPMRDGRQVDIKLGPLPECVADPMMLRQVFLVLLTNALKYTRRHAAAVIEVGGAGDHPQPGQTTYFVKDDGIGFDMRYADKLFGMFQQLHPGDDHEGTGAGLALAHRIIQRHGGRIWAEAAVDQGATFSFTLGTERSD